MTRAFISLLALALACVTGSSDPAPVADPSPGPVGTTEPEPAEPEAPYEPPQRDPVSMPTEPALSSFTGQGTQLGIGLWCAFYPLGWSNDGRFAWATERRVNDMAIEYGAVWRVLPVGSDAEGPTVSFGVEDFPEGATLTWAWEQRNERVETMLSEQHIRAGGTELLPLPVETMVGTLDARWEVGGLANFVRPAKLLMTLGGGAESTVLEVELSDLADDPEPPKLLLSPSGQHAALVIPVVTGEPVEALVDIRYHVHGVLLGPT